MPDFAWQALTTTGKAEQGRITAPSVAVAVHLLRERGLTPVSVKHADTASGTATSRIGQTSVSSLARQSKGPVNKADVLALTSELAIMLRAGLALDNALRVLIDMSHKPSVAALVVEILDAVKGGVPLSRALNKRALLFGDFYINMVKSGEASGQLSSVFDRLVDHLERQRSLKDSVISATIYPAILLGVAVLSLVAMLGFVVPQFEKLFTDMGDALPYPTRLVMGLGQVFTQYGYAMGILLVLLGYVMVRWLQSAAGVVWWQSAALKLPLVGPIALKYQLTLFARSLGTLLGNGVPMLMALNISTETVSNLVLQKALSKLAPTVKEGGKVAQAFVDSGVFQPLAINLVRVGEESGRIGPMMLELANILNREVEIGIKRLLTLVEPLLILVLGAAIAAIIVSILLGILSINDLAG